MYFPRNTAQSSRFYLVKKIPPPPSVTHCTLICPPNDFEGDVQQLTWIELCCPNPAPPLPLNIFLMIPFPIWVDLSYMQFSIYSLCSLPSCCLYGSIAARLALSCIRNIHPSCKSTRTNIQASICAEALRVVYIQVWTLPQGCSNTPLKMAKKPFVCINLLIPRKRRVSIMEDKY